MNEDTVIIRVKRTLRDKLKEKAQHQGRTLEWMTNDALQTYLLTPQAGQSYQAPEPVTELNEGVKPIVMQSKMNPAMQKFLETKIDTSESQEVNY